MRSVVIATRREQSMSRSQRCTQPGTHAGQVL